MSTLRPAAARRQTVVPALSCLLAIETMLYSAVTPLLPYYAERMDLGKTAVGVLVALYAAGIVVGSLLGLRITAGRGVRVTVTAGLLTLAVATLVFGFAESIWALDFARLVQGIAAGCMCSGVLAWLLLAVGDRRGGALGGAMATAVVGTIAGPLLGTAAVQLGPRAIYGALALLILCLAAVPLRLEAPVDRLGAGAPLAQVIRPRLVVVGIWLVLFAGLVMGGVHALIPLRLADLGASDVALGAVFFGASVASVVMSPLVGRLSDHVGTLLPPALALVVVAVASVAVAASQTDEALAIATIALVGIGAISVWVPTLALVADGAEAAGASTGMVAAILNVTIAIGEAVGGPLSASVSEATGGDGAVFLGMAAVALVSAAAVGWARARDAAAERVRYLI